MGPTSGLPPPPLPPHTRWERSPPSSATRPGFPRGCGCRRRPERLRWQPCRQRRIAIVSAAPTVESIAVSHRRPRPQAVPSEAGCCPGACRARQWTRHHRRPRLQPTAPRPSQSGESDPAVVGPQQSCRPPALTLSSLIPDAPRLRCGPSFPSQGRTRATEPVWRCSARALE